MSNFFVILLGGLAVIQMIRSTYYSVKGMPQEASYANTEATLSIVTILLILTTQGS